METMNTPRIAEITQRLNDTRVADIVATADYTFQVIGKEPIPLFPFSMSWVAITPAHVAEKANNDDFNNGKLAIGTGPYKLSRFLPNNAIELLRDPSHVRNQRVSQWRAMCRAAGFVRTRELGRFPCPLDFDVWTDRMNTPRAARDGLRAVFAAAPSEVRDAFRLDPDGRSWQLEIAVLRADC